MQTKIVTSMVALAAAVNLIGSSTARADTPSVASYKLTFEAREQAEHARAWRAPKHPGFLHETRAPLDWRTGIIDSGLAPLPGGLFDIKNQWHANVRDRHVIVYAGSYRNTSQGVLVMLQLARDGSAASGPDVYSFGARSGPAHITAANGTTLLVKTAAGKPQLFRVRVGGALLR
jgi:hypothetical protein